MALLGQLWYSFLTACLVLVCVYVIAYIRARRFDLIDAAWGALFVVIAWYNFAESMTKTPAGLVLAVMVSVWGVRLCTHIFVRWLRSVHEDARYVELRSSWPNNLVALQILVRIYIVQALLGCIVSLPVIIYMQDQSRFNVWNSIGIIVWLIGFCIEGVADWQLARFIRNTKGALMTTGLWRYSRHPNYFGEMLVWWGFTLFALGVPFGWVGICGALVITLLLRFVSGVPLAEKRLSKRPGWSQYAQRTSMIVPLPPRME